MLEKEKYTLAWEDTLEKKRWRRKERMNTCSVTTTCRGRLDTAHASWRWQVNRILNHGWDVRAVMADMDIPEGGSDVSQLWKWENPEEVEEHWETYRGLSDRSTHQGSGKCRFPPGARGFVGHSNTTRHHVRWQKNHPMCSATRIVKWIIFLMG